ncbi:MAG: CoA-binding protein [Gemmatimonadota bacterium]|nr:CoA-binding protein [Gemmatimonadota bacterium]
MTIPERIDEFLKGKAFGVVGASRDRAKYGNKILRCYLQKGLAAYPINPKETEIEGQPCFPDIDSLPEPVHGISIITPPPVTETIIPQAHEAGIQHVWMQPGAESTTAISMGEELGLSVIGDGSCLLVVLGYREDG